MKYVKHTQMKEKTKELNTARFYMVMKPSLKSDILDMAKEENKDYSEMVRDWFYAKVKDWKKFKNNHK